MARKKTKCQHCGKGIKTNQAKAIHELWCKENPNRKLVDDRRKYKSEITVFSKEVVEILENLNVEPAIKQEAYVHLSTMNPEERIPYLQRTLLSEEDNQCPYLDDCEDSKLIDYTCKSTMKYQLCEDYQLKKSNIIKEFLDYLKQEGYSIPDIIQAWNVSNSSNYTDQLTLEVMTRDILRKKYNRKI